MRAVLEHFEFRVNATYFGDLVAARGITQRLGLGRVQAFAVKTLRLQEIVRDRGLQINAVSSKANKADLGAKVSALRAACGIVVLGELTCETIDEGGTGG